MIQNYVVDPSPMEKAFRGFVSVDAKDKKPKAKRAKADKDKKSDDKMKGDCKMK